MLRTNFTKIYLRKKVVKTSAYKNKMSGTSFFVFVDK